MIALYSFNRNSIKAQLVLARTAYVNTQLPGSYILLRKRIVIFYDLIGFGRYVEFQIYRFCPVYFIRFSRPF